jgi:hypothetical protein
MLKIVLGHNAISTGVGISGQLQILLIDMAGRAANFDFGARGIIGAVGIETAPIVAAATAAAATIATMLRPAAASARALHDYPFLAARLRASKNAQAAQFRFALSPLPGSGFFSRRRPGGPAFAVRKGIIPSLCSDPTRTTTFFQGNPHAFRKMTQRGTPDRSGAILKISSSGNKDSTIGACPRPISRSPKPPGRISLGRSSERPR